MIGRAAAVLYVMTSWTYLRLFIVHIGFTIIHDISWAGCDGKVKIVVSHRATMAYYYFDFCNLRKQYCNLIKQNDPIPRQKDYKIIKKGGYTSVIQNQNTRRERRKTKGVERFTEHPTHP